MSNVIVVGGGVIGLSTAYQLAKRGHKVRLLEQVKAEKTPVALDKIQEYLTMYCCRRQLVTMLTMDLTEKPGLSA